MNRFLRRLVPLVGVVALAVGLVGATVDGVSADLNSPTPTPSPSSSSSPSSSPETSPGSTIQTTSDCHNLQSTTNPTSFTDMPGVRMEIGHESFTVLQSGKSAGTLNVHVEYCQQTYNSIFASFDAQMNNNTTLQGSCGLDDTTSTVTYQFSTDGQCGSGLSTSNNWRQDTQLESVTPCASTDTSCPDPGVQSSDKWTATWTMTGGFQCQGTNGRASNTCTVQVTPSAMSQQ